MIELRTIAVIGAGRLGRALAALCSRNGYRTILEDVLPANLRKARADFDGSGESPRNGAAGVEFASSVEDAVREADLIVDCVPDELESKLEIFSLLDRMAPPRAILATPTKTLSIADLASCTYRAERCVALEMNGEAVPGPLTVVHSSRTLPEVTAAVVGFAERLGFAVEVSPDSLEQGIAERA